MSNWSVGHNLVGYMPESDVYITSDHENAKRALIDDLEFAADQADMVDDHDEAEQLSGAAEDLNLISEGREWGVIVGNISYWLNATDETPDEEE